MRKKCHHCWTAPCVALSVALLAGSARADFTIGQNLAFNAGGKNPWSAGDAFEFNRDYALLDIKNAHADFGPVNADPTEIVLDLLGNALGVDIPDFGVVELEVGGTVSGSAFVGVQLRADAGKLAVSYPGHADLNVQADAGGVKSRQKYSIGSGFQSGLNVAYKIPEIVRQGVFAGPGYAGPAQLWGQIDHTTYSQPTFSTTAPYFDARLVANVDVHAGVYGKVSAGWGALEGRTNYTLGASEGGTIVEVDPSGLYVFGEGMGLFDLTKPIDIPISGVGLARVKLPSPAVNGVPAPQNDGTLHGEYIDAVFELDTDVEKLVPVIGSLLHNSLPPLLTYDLAHIGLKPKVSLYQDLTFTPDPRVRLRFSETVRVNGSLSDQVELKLGEALQWTPIFSNSDQITITPEYVMRNSFRHETGIALDVDVTFDALGFSSPLLPGYVGPLVHETDTIPVGRVALYEPAPWEVDMPEITGSAFTMAKYNAAPGLTDVHLTYSNLVGGGPNSPAIFELRFERTIDGQAHQFQTTAPGYYSTFSIGCGPDGGCIPVDVFTTSADVVFTDPVTSEQFNLGQDFNLNYRALPLPAPSPALLVEDPNHPGQFLAPLALPHLDEIPYAPIDIDGHPIFGGPALDQAGGAAEVVNNPTIVDRRSQSATNVLLQSIDLVPEGDAQFGPLPKAVINDAGAVAVQGSLQLFDSGDGAAGPGLYLFDRGVRAKLARPGDAIPGGGTLTFDVSPAFSQVRELSASGAVAFHANGGAGNSPGVYRARTAGVEPVARHGQATPAGDKYLYFAGLETPVAINDNDDVAFAAYLTNAPGVYQLDSVVGVFRGAGASLVEIARTGQSAPLPPGGSFQSIGLQVDLNDSGDVAFSARTCVGCGASVFRGNGQTLVTIAAFQSSVAPGWVFDSGINLRINNSGQVAFLGSVYQPGIGNFRTGVYRGNGSALTEVARVGLAAPDLDGNFSSINQAINPGFNQPGQVAFLAHVSGAADYDGLFRSSGAALQRIVRSGQVAPDGDGVFLSFAAAPGDEIALNNLGHLAFHSTLASTTHNQGVFVYDGANIVQVVRTGQSLAGSTVAALSAPSLNDRMQVAYTARLADGRDVAARFEPTIFWRNAGGGAWGAPANWSLNIEPITPYDVRIVAEHALAVAGPAANRTVNSLAIGGANAAAPATLDLVAGATLTANEGTTLLANGVLSGYGALAGPLTSRGVVRVGGAGAAPAGTLALGGDVTLEPANRLELEIQGIIPAAQFDRLAVAGDMHLDGALAVTLAGGFHPALGNAFQILSAAGALDGHFDMTTTQLPKLSGGLGWLLRYDPHEVALQVIPRLIGDFNADGGVARDDLAVWRATLGSTTNFAADADGDLDVDGADLLLWQRHLGNSSPLAGSSAVPEPASAVLAGAVLVGCGTLRRRTRRS